VEDVLRRGRVERAVEGDDAAEGTGRVGGVGPLVGLAAAAAHRHAAGAGVLDDHAGGRVELAHAFPGRIGVGDVVVARLLAVQLGERSERTGRRMQVAVERGLLVRVLAVTQVHYLDEAAVGLGGERRAHRYLARAVGDGGQI